MNYEFYPTPDPFTRWLFAEVPIGGQCAEVSCGSGAIIDAAMAMKSSRPMQWRTNDLDPRWPADAHMDATDETLYTKALGTSIDWNVGNPAFTPAVELITVARRFARIGVAMHLRASIHEVLKTGVRRTWMAQCPPTGILWLPRFAYQRSPTTGKWTTDSVCACWCIWLTDRSAPQFVRYAPEWVLDELNAFTPTYREQMDRLMETYHEQERAVL